ncbi:MAG: ABC transporter ATP-binding protein, partial [Dehalococcoidia bacterium]|nr:ABC transporter ATP-binding protein [Dehalococcoidia bacterium]
MERTNGPRFDHGPTGASAAPTALLARIRGTASAGARVVGLVWRTSPALTLGMAVVTLARSVQPAADIWVSKLLIDAVAAAVFTGAGQDAVPGIVWLAGAQLGLLVAGSLLGAVRNIVQQLLQEQVSLAIQTQIMEQANRLDLAAFEDATFYDRLQQAQREVTFRPVAMVSELFNLARMVVTFGTMVGLLLSLSWIIALVALLAPIPSFIAST